MSNIITADTDSLLVQIQINDINADLIDMADQFDFSDYLANYSVRQTLGEKKIKANKKTLVCLRMDVMEL